MSLNEYFNNLVEEKERLSNENADLKRALDKACEFLAKSHVTESGWSSKDKWKEWCMKK